MIRPTDFITARAYARAVLGVVILSVRLSVCLSHAWIVTKLNDAMQIFYTTRKGNHSATLIPRVVGRRCSLPSEICVQSDPPPFEKRRLRPISAHNVSTVGDSEKKFNHDEYKVDHGLSNEPQMEFVRYPKCPNGWLKVRVFRFFYRATACNATHGIAVGILSVPPSVRLSVRCVYCDKTKQRTANILIPHETAITLVF